MGLEGAVEITDYLPYWDVAPYINVAEVGLMLSSEKMENYRLTLPYKIIDFMACGVPFIGSKLPQVEQIVKEENCGVLVDSTDIEGIAKAMGEILTDKKNAEELGRNGLKAVEGEYSWGRIEERLAGIFEALN